MCIANIVHLGSKELHCLIRDPILLFMIGYTFTVGVYAAAVAMPETDPQNLVGAADLGLYKAKHAGRNRVFQTASLDPQDD